jgi:hypothetical protein
MLKNKATILSKEKDGLIRLYKKTLVTALKTGLTDATEEIRKAQEKDLLAQQVSLNRQDYPL